MKTRLTHHWLTAALTSCALAAFGCAADSTDAFNDEDIIAEEIELLDGGLDMEDEAPVFGDEARFDEADLLGDEPAFTDEMETDAEVVAMREKPDAVLYAVTVLWGQIPVDFENQTPYNWSGALRINRGAMLVRRVLRFDGRVDHIAPRTDRQVVQFRSATLPGNDGLRLLLIDPEPTSEEPLVITYEQVDGDEFSTPLAAVLGEAQSREMDDAGNRMVIAAMRRPVDVCENGFVRGRWHKVRGERGRILGRVANSDGEPLGHLRGVFGQRLDGTNVWFAKFINRDGEFRGILRGHYRAGHFAGRWATRSGDRGAIGGHYRETVPGPRIGGHFIGRWAEKTCNLDLGRDGEGTDPEQPSDRPTDAETDGN